MDKTKRAIIVDVVQKTFVLVTTYEILPRIEEPTYFHHVLRCHNKAADKLANLAMDRKGFFVEWNQKGMDSILQHIANDSNAYLNVRFDGGYRPNKTIGLSVKGQGLSSEVCSSLGVKKGRVTG